MNTILAVYWKNRNMENEKLEYTYIIITILNFYYILNKNKLLKNIIYINK